MVSIIVYNLHPRVTRQDLIDLFTPYGALLKVILLYGYAIIYFENYQDAINAMNDIYGQELDGYRLTVTLGN